MFGILFLVLQWVISTCAGKTFGGIERGEPQERHTVLSGGKLSLPCDIISPSDGDEVYLVLWYKGDIATPIYSFDARRGHVGQARHSSKDFLTGRAYFNTVPRPAVLEISGISPEDEGEYRCRVDFRKAQTRNYQIAVKVLIPPGKPEIKDELGKALQGVIRSYNEGDTLYLICESKGGKPTPVLTWWRGPLLIDDTFEVTSTHIVRNELQIDSLTRKDLMAEFTCQASNNNVSSPMKSSISVDLNFRPLVVKIEGPRQPFKSGERVQLKCSGQGSRPPAVLTWKKAGSNFKNPQEEVVTGGNATISVFSFTPTPEDHGHYVTCRAENPLIPGSGIEDGWKMEVHFVPQLSLRLGSKLRHSNILEGNDVYFECTIKSSPWVHETGWRFEGQELVTNISAGVIVSNQSLVLQKVQRRNRGRYSCTGTNSEGQGESNHVYLRVQFTPICKSGQQTVYGAMLHFPVEIACEVEADPDDVSFRWEFNSSFGTLELEPTITSGRKSVVHYIPRSEQDFGTLSCWGRNRVGLQRMPCLFVVIPAEPPSAVHNCTIGQETEYFFRVSCYEGKDGGLNQYFQSEVRGPDSTLLFNLTSQTADFAVRGLSPGTIYTLTMYAVNAKGRSTPLIIKASTLSTPESQTRREDVWELSLSPVLLVLFAVIGGIVLVAFSIILYLKFQGKRNIAKGSNQSEDKKNPSSSDPDHKNFNHCLCEHREEEQLKHFTPDSYVIIENSKPDVTGEATAKTESVYWKKLPLDSSNSENFINPRLKIKLPLQTELETPDIERTRTYVASPTESFTHGSAIIVKQRSSPNDRSPSSVSLTIRHTDV
ncbi:neural cell adhesion molecule 2 [Parasteatoda tepidariorum]|uniref:neural cell adhesion molecule 2 n=1 Tax=Parasteatoda tepidariorum TaxID=114398 RepID=UPI00077F9774|nr:hemicentin-1 [Parasteatoda tepidariorum]